MDFTGKVALVTGAGSGIGKATAMLLAKQGVRVAALSRTVEEIEQTVAEIQRNGDEAIATHADISQDDQMKRAMEQVVEQWGRLDLVFANAGINGVWAPIDELDINDWAQTININLTGTFLTIKYAVPHIKRQGGSIVITASVNGTRIFSNTGAIAYSATKAGQVAMAKMLAVELGPHNIRVNVVCPGKTETSIGDNTQHRNLARVKFPVQYPKGTAIPLGEGKAATSEQVSELVAFLLSDAANQITGTEVWIDGGSSLIQG
jgi:NAD(P)-dependent dehydrogenase (short-subunit alcohol dehydrogenase family)